MKFWKYTCQGFWGPCEWPCRCRCRRSGRAFWNTWNFLTKFWKKSWYCCDFGGFDEKSLKFYRFCHVWNFDDWRYFCIQLARVILVAIGCCWLLAGGEWSIKENGFRTYYHPISMYCITNLFQINVKNCANMLLKTSFKFK